jgi:flagellar hook-length control protein FliK
LSAVASDAVLYSSSAHRAGSSAHRGRETNERAESSPFSDHLDNLRETRSDEGRSEAPARSPSSTREHSGRTASSSAARDKTDRTKTDRSDPADDDRAGSAAGDRTDAASPAAAKAVAKDTAAKADTAPASGEDAAGTDTVNTLTPADALDETTIDPATGEPVAADQGALAAAAAQALEPKVSEKEPAKDSEDQKKTDNKADTGTDTAVVADKTASSADVAPVVAATDGATPPPADDAAPVKAEAGKALTIDLHPAVVAQAVSLKATIDTVDAGKGTAANALTTEDKTGLPQAKPAGADQADNADQGATKAPATPIHRQTTTEHNDISAIKPATDADMSTRSAQNGNANPTPPVNTGTPAQHSTSMPQAPAGGPAPAPAPSQPVPIAGLGVALAAKAMEGKNRFEIRLDPPELGKIEVRLEVHRNGEVTSRMIADRPDTLDLLRRDAAGLERALQDAGLKTAGNGLQFSLRDQGFAGHDRAPERSDTAHIVVKDDIQSVSELPQRQYRPLAGLRGGLDIRV